MLFLSSELRSALKGYAAHPVAPIFGAVFFNPKSLVLAKLACLQ